MQRYPFSRELCTCRGTLFQGSYVHAEVPFFKGAARIHTFFKVFVFVAAFFKGAENTNFLSSGWPHAW